VWFALTAWCVAAACIAVGLRQWRKVLALADDAESLLAECRSALRAGRPLTEQPRLASELQSVLEASSPECAVAAFNERVADVARDLAVGADVPRAAARIGLFSGVVLGVIELTRALGSSSDAPMGTVLAAFFAGAVAAVVGFELDRRARREAGRGREAWNALGRLLAPRPLKSPQ
jgi:hypothetical protein